MLRWRWTAALTLVALPLGCARVDVRKVPARSDYETWGDAQQRAADSICGARYYLPRPYLAVDEPFAVAGGDLIVPATVSAEGQLLSLNVMALPASLRKHVGIATDAHTLTLDTATVHVPAARNREARDQSLWNVRQQGEASSSGQPSVEVVPVLLDGSGVSPALLNQNDLSATVTVALGEAHGFTEGADPRPALVPLTGPDRSLSAKDVVLLTSSAPTPLVPAKKGTWTAAVRREQVRAHAYWTVALQFVGRKASAAAGTPATTFLLVHGNMQLNVPDAAQEPKEAGKQAESKETEEAAEPPVPTSMLAARGDPATDPLKKINRYVSIVLLPDFEEQYALSVDGGLGQSSASIGLENGWMAERMGWQVDNRELGRFVFRQIEKFTDVAADLVRTELLPTVGDPGTESAQALLQQAARFTQQGAGGASRPGETGGRVLLRVRHLVEAQPGLYPLLKPWETENWQRFRRDADGCRCTGPACETDDAVLLPFRPYTIAAYNVRRKVVFELISTRPATGEPPMTLEASADERQAVMRFLAGLGKVEGIGTLASKAQSVLEWIGGEGNVTRVEWTHDHRWRVLCTRELVDGATYRKLNEKLLEAMEASPTEPPPRQGVAASSVFFARHRSQQ